MDPVTCQNCWRTEEKHLGGKCIVKMDSNEATVSDWMTFTPSTSDEDAIQDWVETPREDDHIRPASFGTLATPELKEDEVPYFAPSHTDPGHYTMGRKYETWDVIEDWKLGFVLGNCVKYLSRAGRKGGNNSRLSDLIKARNYLDREITKEEADG
jgi:hypothetical protein